MVVPAVPGALNPQLQFPLDPLDPLRRQYQWSGDRNRRKERTA
jgi:hypothetical protein